MQRKGHARHNRWHDGVDVGLDHRRHSARGRSGDRYREAAAEVVMGLTGHGEIIREDAAGM